MAEIDILAELQRDNPEARAMDLQRYADALQIYFEGVRNIKSNGAICQHPRTGAPMENPYLSVMVQQGKTLAKMKMIRADRVLELLKFNDTK